MLGKNGRPIVVIARVARHNKRIALSWQWCDHIAEGHIGEPGCAIVSRLARPHPVAGDARVTLGATGALAPVIPHGENGATRANRNVRLPLRTGRGIAVQLERRTKGYTAISGADIIDVASICAGAVLRIHQVNNAVQGGRFTPTLVSPETTLISKHAGEIRVVAASRDARPRKRSSGVRVAPGIAGFRGSENLIG